MSEIKYCSLCGRSEDTAGPMVNLAGMFRICPDCMQKTMDSMTMMTGQNIFNPMMNMSNQNNVKTEDTDENMDEEIPEIDDADMNAEYPEDDVSDEDESKTKEKKSSPYPNIRFINMGDMASMFRPGAQVKNQKKKSKNLKPPIKEIKDIPKPHIIKQQLDEYVVGQEQAKKVLSVAVYNHYKRILSDQKKTEYVEIDKSNVLMLGPTGSGKTYLVRTLAKLLNVPLAITDATSLTEAGYIGDDIESVVSKLLAEADNDVERAEQGIIFIDEIDKIAKKKNAHARDVSGESVQQGMLKLLEGAEVEVPVGASSKNAMVPMATVNTKNILFICGGAFPDIEEIIKKRLTKKSSIGYNATLKDAFDQEKNILSKVQAEDLREFGMIPEFIGRMPVVCSLEGLTDDMLVRILKEPKNAIIRQYENLLMLDEVKLVFEEDALYAIAKKAKEKETGARALRAILEELMLDVMYEVPKDSNIGMVTITRDYVEGKGSPVIALRG